MNNQERNEGQRQCCREHWKEDASEAIKTSSSHILSVPFIVCRTCGNKRCPKATCCRIECTGSNEPGQEGSAY